MNVKILITTHAMENATIHSANSIVSVPRVAEEMLVFQVDAKKTSYP